LLVAAIAAPVSSQPVFWSDAYVNPGPARAILPQPKAITWLGGTFVVAPGAQIVVADDAVPEDLYATRELNEEVAAWGQPALPVVRASSLADTAEASGGLIVVGEPARHPLLASLLAREGLQAEARPEGYVVRVTPRLVVAAGADRRGTFYAVQTLRQLFAAEAGRLRLAAVEVRDWPDHPIRAVHVVLDNYSDVFHTALIERVFSRYKLNMMIMESEYVQWDSARNIRHPGGATKAQAAVVIAAARAHLIEPVPLVQTLGHAEWLFHNSQNLELLEMPAELAPARYVYNPLNPRVYDIVLPIFDEAIALFRPRWLHIGHDEVRNVVPFPWSEEGRRLGFGELFVRDSLRLHEHLRSRGVGTMMWADVLLTNEFMPEIARLPRDILMVDWQYHDAARYPSVDRLRGWGFPVLAATWYRHDNVASFAREALRAGAAGMLRTTWTGYFGNRAALQQGQQIAGYLAAADHFWDAASGEPRLDAVAAAVRFRADWRDVRPVARAVAGRPIDLRAYATRSHIDDGAGWLEKGSGYDLRNLPSGPQRLGGVLFDVIDPASNGGRSVVMLRGSRAPAHLMPPRIAIPFGQSAAELCVLHTLPYPGTGYGETVGVYHLYFDDGESTQIPVQFRRNIGTWLDDPIALEHEIAWTGRTRSGVDARLSLLCWVNPRPERRVVVIELRATGAGVAPVVFAVTALAAPRAAAPAR
jgi:hypothetical protein